MDRRDSPNPASGNTEGVTDSSTHPAPAPAEAGPHDFEAQKRIHQQIRNDPDYDDWEYGTEPLPHEAWSADCTTRGTSPTAGEKP